MRENGEEFPHAAAAIGHLTRARQQQRRRRRHPRSRQSRCRVESGGREPNPRGGREGGRKKPRGGPPKHNREKFKTHQKVTQKKLPVLERTRAQSLARSPALSVTRSKSAARRRRAEAERTTRLERRQRLSERGRRERGESLFGCRVSRTQQNAEWRKTRLTPPLRQGDPPSFLPSPGIQ